MQYNFKLGVSSWLLLAPSAVLVAFASPSYAQLNDINQVETLAQAPNPQGDANRERFVQPPLNPQPLPSEPEEELKPIPAPETTPAQTSEQIEVKKVEVKGSTIFSTEKLSSITQGVEGSTVSLEQLQKVADDITQLYLNQGYLTSRAVLPQQTITDGIVQIRVIEGSLEKVEIQGTRRLQPNFVRSRIIKAAGTPLSAAKLEDELRILKSNPLFKNVEASLRPGTGEGQSILKLRVTEAKQFSAAASFDNYSPPSIGSERLGISAVYRNLTGAGDEISGAYYRSLTGGSDIYDFSYRLPMNAMDGTLQMRGVINNNQVTQAPFDELDIRGESELYEISFRQPLMRSIREEFALSVGFSVQNGEFSTALSPSATDNRTRVIKLGQDYVKRDENGAWGVRSQFSIGTGLLNATKTSDSTPDGQFVSWLVQGQRVQQLNNENLLIAQVDLQLTPNPLLSSQQFVIGGGQSVRGFRQNARSGDNGLRLSVEDRITVKKDASGNPILQVAPFVDAGLIWNANNNPNTLPSQTFLAGAGVGVLWKPLPRMNVRLDYGLPLINLDDRGDNIQDDGLYFSLGYRI